MTNVIKNSIPNTVTCLNLFSGCIACVMAFEAKYELALLFIAFKFHFRLLRRIVGSYAQRTFHYRKRLGLIGR